MATVVEQSYAESIGTRINDRPRRRAELSNALYDAEIAITDAAAEIAQRGMVELEGWSDAREEQWPPLGEALERYRRASRRFEKDIQGVEASLTDKAGGTGSKAEEGKED